jgi:hypothetical protein
MMQHMSSANQQKRDFYLNRTAYLFNINIYIYIYIYIKVKFIYYTQNMIADMLTIKLNNDNVRLNH